jgi:hypothetical protein
MASAPSAPVFEMVAGIRTIAESGRFKASSSPHLPGATNLVRNRLIVVGTATCGSGSSLPICYCYMLICLQLNLYLSCLQAWFLDQFGVLHDGKKPYPGAILACMLAQKLCSKFFRLYLSPLCWRCCYLYELPAGYCSGEARGEWCEDGDNQQLL